MKEPKKLLDSFCQHHDIPYALLKDDKNPELADQELTIKALERFKSKDASLGEKIAVLGVAGVRKAKTAFRMG